MAAANNKIERLIVGGDSHIGKALLTQFVKEGKSVVGTTRRKSSQGNIFLDLSDEEKNWRIPPDTKVAIICAGVTRIAECERDPQGTGAINVEKILRLAQKLIACEAHVIYLSTNQVFDGATPHCPADAPYSPITEYGRQKAELEKFLLGKKNHVTIIRFSKIIGPDFSLFVKWTNALLASKNITPFSDMFFSPLPLTTAVNAIKLLADERPDGVFQLSGPEEISYAQAASWGAEALNAPPELVRPIMAAEGGIAPQTFGHHSTLDISRFREIFGLVPPPAKQAITWAFQKTKEGEQQADG